MLQPLPAARAAVKMTTAVRILQLLLIVVVVAMVVVVVAAAVTVTVTVLLTLAVPPSSWATRGDLGLSGSYQQSKLILRVAVRRTETVTACSIAGSITITTFTASHNIHPP
jgi:hypothetical protein